METPESVLEINSKLGEQINAEALANPQSPYAGKFVGLANGEVVIVDEDLDRVCDELERVEPDDAKTFIVEAGIDYNQVVYMWEWPGCRELHGL